MLEAQFLRICQCAYFTAARIYEYSNKISIEGLPHNMIGFFKFLCVGQSVIYVYVYVCV
jgi:hypothetical protein